MTDIEEKQRFELASLHLGSCFKHLSLVIFPWFLGYYNFSFAWIIMFLSFGAFIQAGHVLAQKRKKLHKPIKEEDDVKEIWPTMPSWIYFSEEEHALWVNKILDQMWPYIEDMVEEILKTSVEPAIQACLPAPLQALRFEKMSLGQTPLYITHIRTYHNPAHSNPSQRDDEFIMDLDVVYNGDANFELGIKKVKLGVSDLEIHGPLRVIFKPLVAEYNPVGGVSVFFLNRPKITFELTNLLSVLDIPGLKDILLGIVDDVVASFVVLPNRIAVPLSYSANYGDLAYPIPDGVLRVEITEAKDLIKADRALIGEGSSDPYCILEIGAQKFRTKTKKSNCNPVWKETFEAFIDNTEGQQLFLKVYDEDVATKDEEIGHADYKISQTVTKGTSDVWLPLEGVDDGRVHMKLSWFQLTLKPEDVRQATPSNPTVAALFVKIISAIDLPKDLKDEVNPKILHCTVRVGKAKQDTYTVYSSTPTWDQRLRFLISNPHTETVKIQMMEDDKILCHVHFDIRRIENVPGMCHEGAFPLIGPGFERSALKCKVELRAMKAPEEPPAPSEDDKAPVPTSMSKANLGVSLPAHLDSLPPVSDDEDGNGPLSSRKVMSVNSVGGSSISSMSISPSAGTGKITGEVQLGLRYDHAEGHLVVVIIKADRLQSHYSQHKTNPYVRLYLSPDPNKTSRRKSKVIHSSLSPVYNETFTYEVDLEDLKHSSLDLAVKNARGGLVMKRSRRNLIGKASLRLSELTLSSGVTTTCELRK